MIRRFLKQMFLNGLFILPHNNIYSFHRVCDDPAEKELTGCYLSEENFRTFISTHGPYMSVTDLLHYDKTDGHAALTFDDGLADLYTVAYPFLKERGIPFTAFILTGKLDQPGYLTTGQLLELAADPLVTIGSHGIDHIHLSLADYETQLWELKSSQEKLEELTGKKCFLAAYPFGHFNRTTKKVMKELGYHWGFAVKGRPLLHKECKKTYAVPRLSMNESNLKFYRKS